MSATLATFFGLDQGIVLLAITVLATVATAAAVLAILFFAWGPYLSRDWAQAFGANAGDARSGDEQASD